MTEAPLLDPWREDASADERADAIISRLLLDPDAVRRYDTVRALRDGGRLREVSAISLLQLRAERGTTEAAASAVGITRQAADDLLTKADAPGAREQRAADPYARRYGAWLARCGMVATSDREIDTWMSMEAKAMRHTALVDRVNGLLRTWLRQRPSELRRAHERALSDAMAALDGWDAIRQRRLLTLAERSDAILGLHSARAALRAAGETGTR